MRGRERGNMGKTEKKAGDRIHHKKTKFSIDGERKRVTVEEKDQPLSKERIGVRRERKQGGKRSHMHVKLEKQLHLESSWVE